MSHESLQIRIIQRYPFAQGGEGDLLKAELITEARRNAKVRHSPLRPFESYIPFASQVVVKVPRGVVKEEDKKFLAVRDDFSVSIIKA